MSSADSMHELALTPASGVALAEPSSEIEREVLGLFDEFHGPLLRYTLSFHLSVQDSEEVVQEVFLSLYRHLQLDKSRQNLRGWIFRVAHNLALKQRYANERWCDRGESFWEAEERFDPSPNPEETLSLAQRQERLLAVVKALPQLDQSCIRLRAEGLRYREIAAVLGMSLGAVSISLTRSLARLMRADGG